MWTGEFRLHFEEARGLRSLDPLQVFADVHSLCRKQLVQVTKVAAPRLKLPECCGLNVALDKLTAAGLPTATCNAIVDLIARCLQQDQSTRPSMNTIYRDLMHVQKGNSTTKEP